MRLCGHWIFTVHSDLPSYVEVTILVNLQPPKVQFIQDWYLSFNGVREDAKKITTIRKILKNFLNLFTDINIPL